jgi:hypothetical protein
MEAVLNKQVENTPNYIKLMPAAYKQLFEGMTDGEKNWMASQANNFTLNTSYQVKSFWDSRDFRGINERIATDTIINNNSINENQGKEGYVSLNQINESLRGYSNNYMDALKRRAQN